MQKIGRFTPTGRKLLGPGADLLELEADNGLRHTAIVFNPQYRGHRAINEALDVIRGFLEAPLVAGLVELVEHDRSQGAFVYPTGQSWSVAEVIRSLADMGESGGLRAGLELMYASGQILNEASEIGGMSGIYSHGGLTPWRILVKVDGSVLIVGEGLPQVEILTFAEDQTQVPREDSFRYCPPERIEFEPENLSSDLFGLALISFELMTGKPVYDGLVDDIRQQAARGEGSRRLFKYRDQIPDGIRQLLTTALRPNPQDRHPSGEAFLEEVRKLLSGPEARGPSLAEIMEKVSSQGQRHGKALQGGKTQAISADDRRRILSELEAEDNAAAAAAPQKAQAWAPVARGGKSPVDPPSLAPNVAPAAPPRPLNPAAPPPAATPPAAEGDSRWGPVGRAGRGGRAPASLPDVPQPEPAPTPLPSSGNRMADALIARMRGEQAPAANAVNPPAATPIATPARPAAPAEDEGPRFTPGRVRRAPRRDAVAGDSPFPFAGPAQPEPVAEVRPPTPPPPPPTPAEPTPELLRGRTYNPPPPEPLPPTPSAPPPISPPPARPVIQPSAPTPPPPAINADDWPAPAPPLGASTSMPPAEVDLPGPPAVVRPPLPTAARDVRGGAAFATADLSRAPDSLLSARKADVGQFTFQRESGGKAVRIRLSLKATVGEACSYLSAYIIPVRADLTGQLTGWYRLEQDGRRIPASTTLDQLDPVKPLLIRFVSNISSFADIEIIGGPAPVRFVAPVGTAVPVATLVDHLSAWLGLPDGRWRLHLGGRALDHHAILADESPSALYPLQLRIVAGDESGSGEA